MRRDKPGKIQLPTDARVHLGHGRRLKPTLSASDTGGMGYSRQRGTTDYVADIDALLRPDDPGMLPRQRLKFELEPRDEDAFLEGRGLVASYGIFGAPGSGKTFLFKYMLRQLLGMRAGDPDRKFGALILDPKAALVEDLQAIVRRPDVNREADLVIINAEALVRRNESINVIDCAVDIWALSDLLVLSARSAGITASEDYWFLEWANLFGASLFLLDNFFLEGVSDPKYVVTLRDLLDALLVVGPATTDGKPGPRGIERLAAEARRQLPTLADAGLRADATLAISQIERFFTADYVHTIMAFVARAYGSFQRSGYACYSPPGRTKHSRRSFYDEILEDGKIVLVSVSPADPLVAKTLCTLVKCLFQQTVIQRLDRYMREELDNFERPVLLGCDEYAEIASEVPGQPMGDGRFFSLSREFGCMGLLATQSVNVLQSTTLKENWKSVFSTFGAKVFMRLADNETAKEASELAGKSTWYVTSRGVSHGKDGLSGSEQQSIQQYETLPTEVTTQGFMMGDAVAIGSLSGGGTPELLHFFHVPTDREQDARIASAVAEAQAASASPPPPPGAPPAAARRPVDFDEE
jgi:hypothetical protein